MRKLNPLLALLVLIILFALSAPALAHEDHGEGGTFVPIGGGYPDTYPGFMEAVLEHFDAEANDRIYILMMPMSFSYNAMELTATDLLDNSLAIERRRRQLEDACEEAAPEDLPCHIVIPPLWTRAAAMDELALEYFTDDLAGVYFVGGDQWLAVEIIGGTPVEEALAEAFASGVVMGGNSAGLAIQSLAMIGGYGGDDFGPENALNEGAVDMWNGGEWQVGEETIERRGLSFGVNNVVLEQHLLERARLARLLNALADPETPNIGVGVDGFAGAILDVDAEGAATAVRDVFGLYGAVVVDAETFGAADNATFEEGVLTIHNVLLHLLPPGEFSYDITELTPSFGEVPSGERLPFDLAVPEGAGRLTLLSDAANAGRFLPADRPAYILVMGFADPAAAEELGYVDGQGAVYVETANDLPDLTDIPGIAVVVGDASLVDIELLADINNAWLGGADLILAGDAAALAGLYYANMPPTPYESEDTALIEAATQGTFIEGGVTTGEGWGMLLAHIETSVMDDNRYGRLVSLAVADPNFPAIGLTDGAALVVTEDGAMVTGSNGVFVVDLRDATIDSGDNGGFAIANAWLDVFAPGETVEPTGAE
jgi:cyanophycinase